MQKFRRSLHKRRILSLGLCLLGVLLVTGWAAAAGPVETRPSAAAVPVTSQVKGQYTSYASAPAIRPASQNSHSVYSSSPSKSNLSSDGSVPSSVNNSPPSDDPGTQPASPPSTGDNQPQPVDPSPIPLKKCAPPEGAVQPLIMCPYTCQTGSCGCSAVGAKVCLE